MLAKAAKGKAAKISLGMAWLKRRERSLNKHRGIEGGGKSGIINNAMTIEKAVENNGHQPASERMKKPGMKAWRNGVARHR